MTQQTDQNESSAPFAAARPTRRTLIATAASILVAMPVLAADSSATAFVTGIYETYKGSGAKGLPLDTNRAVRRYFEPSLAALIIRDRKNAHGEVGKLDGDPFIDAQDWNIDKFDIQVTDTAPGKAKATVKFVNLGTPATIVLDLVKIKNEWRVGDITWQHDGKPQTLRALFTHRAKLLGATRPLHSMFGADFGVQRSNVAERIGAGEGNRTLVISLEGFCSTIELHPRAARQRIAPAK